MKKNLKSLTALVLCTTMSLSLAACTSTGSAAQTASDVTASAGAAVDPPTAADSAVAESNAADSAVAESTAASENAGGRVSYAGTSGSADDYFIPVAESVDSFKTSKTALYMNDLEKKSEIEVGFLNGMNDIPYLSLDTIAQLLKDTYEEAHPSSADKYQLTVGAVTDDNTCFALIRENDSTMIIDFNAGTITFTDIETFCQNPDSVAGLDLVDTGDTLIEHDIAFYRTSQSEVIDLTHYGILPVLQDGTGYLPMQTIADLIFSRIGLYLLYNGEEMIVADGIESPNADEDYLLSSMMEGWGIEETDSETSTDSDQNTIESISDLYYSAEKGEKSEELANFTYNELCLALDYNYGLQEAHDITSFNQLFIYSDMSEKLRSTDAGETYKGLTELTGEYFNDFHSGTNAPSYLTDLNTSTDYDVYKYSTGYNMDMTYAGLSFSMARDPYYPDGIVGYEEVGDTAYVTFDEFNFDPERDYYNTEITNNAEDTIELIIYANKQIKREGSPIKNVVIDLSNNGGGYLDTAVCVLSWILDGVSINMKDPITGNEGATYYRFDANLNGSTLVSDTEDYLYSALGNGVNIFAIISPNSFSCGNLVPCMLKQSGRVTLIGRSSGGGACCVLPLSSADGQIFQISGPYRISTVQNGSYYSVDQGVEPDVYISDLSHIYDREYMTNLIDNLD